MKQEFQNEWDKSYSNKDNHMFYPHEEVVRFVSKYIRKKVGMNDHIDQCNIDSSAKILDFGCGIGRHMKLLHEFKLNSKGFDLSIKAIEIAKNIFLNLGMNEVVENLIVADITNLPYSTEEFDFMLSHGVIDSTPLEVAKKGMLELHRTLKKDGYIFFDVIGLDDPSFSLSKEGENYRIVKEIHEQDTIQSYFDLDVIQNLLGSMFNVVEFYNIKKYSEGSEVISSRYYIVAQKK
jgi:SAM-dependent methyltransferase